MTKGKFIEGILKHADRDYEESVRMFEETGICLWCEGTRTILDNDRAIKCPICASVEDREDRYNAGVGEFDNKKYNA